MKQVMAVLIILAMASVSAQADLGGLWRFDEGSGSTAADSSGNANTGTFVGPNITWDTGKYGGAIKTVMDGANLSYVLVPAASSLEIGPTAGDSWTLALWAYEISVGGSYAGGYGRMITFDDADSTTPAFAVLQFESGANGDDQLYTWSDTLPGGAFDTGLGVPQILDQWNHYALVYDGTTGNMNLYRNGSLVAGPFAENAAVGAESFVVIGSQNQIPSVTRNWNGFLDEVAVFTEKLSPTQIQTIMDGDFSQWGAGDAYAAHSPDPAHKATGVSVGLDQLGWGLPAPRSANDEPNDLVVDVYFGDSSQEALVISGDASVRIETQLSSPGIDNSTDNFAKPLTINETYYWRVDVYDPNDGNGGAPPIKTEGIVWNFSTAEPTASEPSPSNGASSVSIFTELSWTEGANAVSHTLYGPSTDQTAVANGTAPSETIAMPDTSYDPNTTLDLDTTYYWRVDTDDGSPPLAEGAVWSFTVTDTDVIADFGWVPGQEAELRAVWIGDPNENIIVPSPSGSGWVFMPYVEWTQTYTKTFEKDLDLSSAVRMTSQYFQMSPDSVVTLKLLDAGDQELFSTVFTDFQINVDAIWQINLLTGSPDLSAVRKIQVVVPGLAEPAGGFYMNDITVTTTAECPTPPTADLVGNDCIVDMFDFAEFARQWLACGIFPPEMCP